MEMEVCLFLFSLISIRLFFVNSNYDICVNKLDTDHFRSLRVLKGHNHPVSQIVYDEQMYYVFSCGEDGLFLWDLNKEGGPIQL